MKWLRGLLAQSGLGHFNVSLALGAALLIAGFAGLLVGQISGVIGLGFAGLALGMSLQIELLMLRAKVRTNTIVVILPQVVEAIQAAIVAGIQPHAALQDVASSGPIQVRESFAQVCTQLDTGRSMDRAMNWLKREFGSIHVDQLAEYLVLSQRSGGIGLSQNLKDLATRIRSEQALSGEIGAKQGWVMATAKLALVTPWLIVWLLAAKPENAIAYNSPTGTVLLLVGLIVCLLAYVSIGLLGRLPKPRRVLTA
jgi:tight adherence protein B